MRGHAHLFNYRRLRNIARPSGNPTRRRLRHFAHRTPKLTHATGESADRLLLTTRISFQLNGSGDVGECNLKVLGRTCLFARGRISMAPTSQPNRFDAPNSPLETVELDADPEGLNLLRWLAEILRIDGPGSQRLRTAISAIVDGDATDADRRPSGSTSPSGQQCH